MKKKNKIIILITTLLIILSLFFLYYVFFNRKDTLSISEKQWIDNNDKVHVFSTKGSNSYIKGVVFNFE